MSQKILGFKDVVIMSVAANLGIRWIAIAAGMGPVSLVFWLLGALLFFIPFALIVSEFSTKYPDEGGIYVWVRHLLGGRASFVTAWCYWVTNFFFYPAILTFAATSFAYAFNKPNLASSEVFVTMVVIIAFWLMTFLTLFGLRVSKFITEFGGVAGTFFIFMVLIVLGFLALLMTHHSATHFTLSGFLPNGSLVNNLSSLSLLMFAMAGIEIIPTLANSIERPSVILPRALMVAAFIIFVCYALGTLAMNFIATPTEIANTTGLVSTFALIAAKFHAPWLLQFIALLIIFAEFSALAVWVLVPVVMLFRATERGILPDFLHRQNSRGAPANAIIFQAVLVTIIILITTLLPSVNLMYQVLVLMTTVVYFIPYLIVICAYVKFKLNGGRGDYVVPGGKVGAMVASVFVFVSLVLAIGMSFVPTSNLIGLKELLIYEGELVGGPVLLVIAALVLYARRRR